MKKRIFFIVVCCLFLFSCTKTLHKEEFVFYAMDTTVSVSFYDVENAQEHAKEIENIFLKYHRISDMYQETGEVYLLNRNRQIEASADFVKLLEFSLEMQRETNGYFNPLIGGLSEKWKTALKEKRVLSDEEVQNEVRIYNESSIEIRGNEVFLSGDALLDLGGVAKGYATQKANEYLESQKITSVLLNAGRSNIVLKEKGTEEFRVGLNQVFSDGYFRILKMKNISLATSSIKEQYEKIDGRIYSHLLNPKTGYPSTTMDSVSVFGADSGKLDAYSTAMFAMSLDEAIRFAEERNLWWIATKEDRILYESEEVKAYETD